LVSPTAQKSGGKHYGFVKWIFRELGRPVKKCEEIRGGGDVLFTNVPSAPPQRRIISHDSREI